MRKFLSIIMSISVLLSTLIITDFPTLAANIGRCGDNITYTYDNSRKTLTLSGTGATYNYEERTNPFFMNTKIESITVEEGITEIGEYIFDHCLNLNYVSLPESLEKIQQCAFRSTKVIDILLDSNVNFLGERAFNQCYNLNQVIFLNPDCYIYDILNISINGVPQDPDDYLCIEKQADIGGIIPCYGSSMAKDYAEKHDMNFYVVGYTHPESSLTLVLIDKEEKTCTTNGKEYYESICQLCGRVDHYENYNYIAQGHKFDNGKITQKTTCIEVGTKTYTCSECKTTIRESIPKLSHKYSTKVNKATTSKNGKIVKTCSVGKESSTTTIYYPKTITLSSTSYNYDGKAKTPKVKVVDSSGKVIPQSNYDVVYDKGRKAIGRYTVKITFKGNYSGTVNKSFEVKPKPTNISSIKSPYKRYIVLYWKKISDISGYQLQISTSSDFKKGFKQFNISAKIKCSADLNKGNIKSNQKYYFRIRTYKNIKYNGKTIKIYSDWSKTKSVKVK